LLLKLSAKAKALKLGRIALKLDKVTT